MTPEDSGALPSPQPSLHLPADPVLSAGMSIAMQWGAALGPEKLEIALKALEPQLKRDHQALMARIEMQRAAAERADAATAAAAVREAQDRQSRRKHIQHMSGLITGAVIAVAMLAGGVYAAKEAWWLSTSLCGPSVYALVKIFVLRRSDPNDMKVLGKGVNGGSSVGT